MPWRIILEMENKTVGWIVVGIGVLVGIIALIFNIGLKKIVGDTCTHGPTCSMYDTIAVQTWISLAIVGVILIIGVVLMFIKPKEKVIVKTIREKKAKKDYSNLDKKEKEVVNLIVKEGNAMFQASLMEKLQIGKVGVTRLLDKLEAKQIIERKRRGMNNIVILKE
jgi:putative component of membrane protein insertase Oxa1/YidC/SpoIIIJ protein YidD